MPEMIGWIPVIFLSQGSRYVCLSLDSGLMPVIMSAIERHLQMQIQIGSKLVGIAIAQHNGKLTLIFTTSCTAHFGIQLSSTKFWTHNLVMSTGFDSYSQSCS